MRTAHPRVVLGLHRSRHERALLTAAADLGVTAIDTSTNYLGFHSHKVLADVAGDLLPKFMVSTKVGYFPAGNGTEHSLAPARLHAALERTAMDLGREPDLVFLHNPEHSLARAPRASASHLLSDSCTVLADATARGLCGAWGVSSWGPRLPAEAAGDELPRPDVVMTRTGLLVGADILHAGEALTARLRPEAIWGMSPFGGSTAEAVWTRFDPRVFMRAPEECTPVQAAFRAAFHLPTVDAVAVGTNKAGHLRELTESLGRAVDTETVAEYRRLLPRTSQED
ncbi:aldo/keto reductase [Streptomyces sp. BH055]|uniref:aldo/keto reductase n=1 Tax=Streptomyces sp. BH055 TaxID=3401173 RepID=UPI003BB7241C